MRLSRDNYVDTTLVRSVVFLHSGAELLNLKEKAAAIEMMKNEGHSTKEIAATLGVSTRTVQRYRNGYVKHADLRAPMAELPFYVCRDCGKLKPRNEMSRIATRKGRGHLCSDCDPNPRKPPTKSLFSVEEQCDRGWRFLSLWKQSDNQTFEEVMKEFEAREAARSR